VYSAVRSAVKTVGFEGEYLGIAPERRLVFTWSKVITHASAERKSIATSQVEVIFTVKDNGTDVRLVPSAVLDDATRNAFGAGWAIAFTTTRALLSH